MAAADFVAGDWGTSHLRLFLCDAAGAVLDQAAGPGAAGLAGRFAEVFDSLAAPWQQRHGPLPAVLCGMVGSSIGWSEAAYVPCPARPEQIAEASVPLRGGSVCIVPGLCSRNRYGAPDFMRGEETQILGALQLAPALRRGSQLLCLPGTHTKWAVLDDGAVAEFLSAPTGELYTLLRDHSVLIRTGDSEAGIDDRAFEAGLAQCGRHARAGLLHLLFECRSRTLAGELAAEAAPSYLSGLLIGADVHGALQTLPGWAQRPVHLIGAPALTALYARALARNGCGSERMEGDAAARAGLLRVRQWLSQPVDANAV